MPNTNGGLIGVSLGPGDPELITRRAYRLLQSQYHWTYPVRKLGGNSYALNIARRAGLEPPRGHTPLVFPMTSDPTRLASAWLTAAEALIEILHRGEDVVFLVEGDASTYATFGHLARSVAALEPNVRIEAVPGVTSFSAAAARLAMPLADSDEAIAILPAGYGIAQAERLLEHFDTLVLLKIKPVLDSFIAWLSRRKLLAHSHLVERVGTPEERIVRDIATLQGETVHYLSLLLVRNPRRIHPQPIRGCRPKSAMAAAGKG
ncbi:MAG: precorrin-2 C(20)-methyltransferase [Gammaproteobacteria bacterium]